MGLKIKILKENENYPFSNYIKGETYEITFEFSEYYLGINTEKYGTHAIAIAKTDCDNYDT
jgi:hypothetical protein